MNRLKIPSANFLRCTYSLKPRPLLFEEEILANRQNPQFLKILDKVTSKPKDELRWVFITRTSAKFLTKAVLRNHLSRRWNAAFLTALKRNGYESNGKRPAPGPAMARPVGLKGTLEMQIHHGAGLSDPIGTLEQQSEAVVKVLMAANRQLNLPAQPRDLPMPAEPSQKTPKSTTRKSKDKKVPIAREAVC